MSFSFLNSVVQKEQEVGQDEYNNSFDIHLNICFPRWYTIFYLAYMLKLILSEVVYWIEHFNTYNSDFNSSYLTASKF